jgi:hypothetical protein
MAVARSLIMTLLLSFALGCAAGGGVESEGPGARDGKEDSPFAEEGAACVTSFDCELGLECVEGGCAPRTAACGSD